VTCHTQQADTSSRGPRNSITERVLRMLSRLLKLQVMRQNSERGATAVEYGLMVALIAIVIIGAVTLLGGNLSSLFNNVATSV
jgi:pilus assembly protein Flp/PilA